MKKLSLLALSAALLSACAVDPQSYKIGTRNGQDLYKFEVAGSIGQPHANMVQFWGEKMCPNGFRVIDSKLDPVTPGITAGNYWWDVTIACPAA